MNTRIAHLRSVLHQANHDYHVLARPTIPDEEFDRLMAELVKLEALHPEDADPNSPTARVGAQSIESFKKVRHAKKMLSLEKVFSAKEVADFFSGCHEGDALAEFKLDGLSLDLTYRDGQLLRAVTRGDGETGDDVTANARTIKTIPMVIKTGFTGSVRGEVLMPRAQLAILNAELEAAGEEPFSNCRNAASGAMKQKDTAECAKRGLVFSAYWSSGADHADLRLDYKWLAQSGFRVENHLVAGLNTGEIELVLNQYAAAREGFEFDTDGVVFKISNPEVRAELGYSRTAPKWAVAFKFPAERKTTQLLDITLTVGRTGQITPNAVLAPVSLAGAVVRAASLCNADEIARLGVNVGDTVVVERANEVIPKVIARQDGPGTPWSFPTTCPCCQTALVRDGVHYFCPNEACEEQVFGRLSHAVGKGALDIDGCGEAAVRSFMAAGAKTLVDLFKPGAEKALDGAARAKFMNAREAAKQQPLWRKLYALGAEHVGRTASKELAARFSSVVEICEARHDDIRAILGPVATASLFETLTKRADEIDQLDQLGLKFSSELAAGPLKGLTFCITGTMVSGSRDSVERKIEAAGGMVKGSVSKKVTYLVSGPGGGQNKSDAAAKCGTRVITEEQLFELLGEKMPELELVEREF